MALLHPGTRPEFPTVREHLEIQEKAWDQPVSERTRLQSSLKKAKTKRLDGRDGERIGEASHPGPGPSESNQAGPLQPSTKYLRFQDSTQQVQSRLGFLELETEILRRIARALDYHSIESGQYSVVEMACVQLYYIWRTHQRETDGALIRNQDCPREHLWIPAMIGRTRTAQERQE